MGINQTLGWNMSFGLSWIIRYLLKLMDDYIYRKIYKSQFNWNSFSPILFVPVIDKIKN